MKRSALISMLTLTLLPMCGLYGRAQSGGDFAITQAVIAAGGTQSAGGDFALDSTIGQPDAGGPIRAGNFAVTSGFWVFTPLAPTAALVSISGRVATPTGQAINNAVLFLQTQEGEIRVARSSSFGYYMFEDIVVGQSVFITVEHKQFTFEPRAVMVSDSITDLDFIGQP